MTRTPWDKDGLLGAGAVVGRYGSAGRPSWSDDPDWDHNPNWRPKARTAEEAFIEEAPEPRR